jgi:hypothetical protein
MARFFSSHVKVLFFGVFFWILNPIVTEHVEFALSSSGLVKINSDNGMFLSRLKEVSTQIVIPEIFLKNGFDPILLQVFTSLALVFISCFALYYLCRLIDSKQEFFYFFIAGILLLNTNTAQSLYPYYFPTSFFEFGNSGFWLFCLSIGLYFNGNKEISTVIAGFLFGWHIPWFLIYLLFFSVLFFHRNWKDNLRCSIFLLIGFVFSLAILKAGEINSIAINKPLIDQIFEMATPEKIAANVFSGHNPLLIDFSALSLKFIALSLLSVVYPSYFLIRRAKSLEDKILPRALIFVSISIYFILIYIEFSRFIPLPFSSMFYRSIFNRYFNFTILLSIICASFELYSHIVKDKFDFKSREIIFSVLALFAYLSFYSLIYVTLILLFLKMTISKFNKKLLGFFLVLSCFLSVLPRAYIHRNYFNPVGYLFSYDNSYRFFSKLDKAKASILLSGVQASRNFNFGLVSGREYYLPSMQKFTDSKGASQNLYCFSAALKSYEDLVRASDACFINRTRKDWQAIFTSLNADTVIVPDKIKLDLILIYQDNGISVYSL